MDYNFFDIYQIVFFIIIIITVAEFAVVYVRHRAHVHVSQRWYPCLQREQEEQPNAGNYPPDIRYLLGLAGYSAYKTIICSHVQRW